MARVRCISSMAQKVVAICHNTQKGFIEASLRASVCLENGGVVALPTDTIYGLATSLSHVNKLYEVKGRNPLKPVAICLADVPQLHKWAKVTVSDDLLDELLPGPVTLIFQRLPSLPSELNPETDLVGIRIPDYDFIRSVARHLNSPLALTSANKSNGLSAVDIQEFSDIWPNLELIVNGGRLPDSGLVRQGSTVIDLSQKGFYKIVRPGCACSKTEEILKNAGLLPSE